LSFHKIRDSYNDARQELRRSPAQQAALDKEQFFNAPEADAEPDYWGKMEFWSLEEALALSVGKNPKVANEANLAAYKDIRMLVRWCAVLDNGPIEPRASLSLLYVR
jgi:hypothetical protein